MRFDVTSAIDRPREKARIGRRNQGLRRPSLRPQERVAFLGRTQPDNHPFVSRVRVKQRPKPAILRTLAILHHDIESAGRENSAVRRKTTCQCAASGDQCEEWKHAGVGDVEPVRVMGAEGYRYGFNVTTEDGKPGVSLPMHPAALA